MFVSTNRTAVQCLTVETVASAELKDLPLEALLLSLESRKLGSLLGERAQVRSHKRAD